MDIYDNNEFQNINIKSNELFRESGDKYRGNNKQLNDILYLKKYYW